MSANRINVNIEKITAIHETSATQSRNKLQRFIELASYFGRFVRGFASIAVSLFTQTTSETNASWNAGTSFLVEDFKNALSKSLFLTYPKFSKACIVRIDASALAVEANFSL